MPATFVVPPEHPWWTDHPGAGGRQGARRRLIYASNTNDEWLGPDELRRVLDA
ncbi:MAG: hypothetical protein U0P45_10190 [Acidimicrobiales bacterium]